MWHDMAHPGVITSPPLPLLAHALLPEGMSGSMFQSYTGHVGLTPPTQPGPALSLQMFIPFWLLLCSSPHSFSLLAAWERDRGTLCEGEIERISNVTRDG